MSKQKPTFSGHTIEADQTIGIIRSVWHGELTKQMEDDAARILSESGLSSDRLFRIVAPGSYEIPLLAKTLIETQRVDGIIAFGVIVQGETHHARLIAEAATKGLMDVQLSTGVPIIDEILLVDDIDTARARTSGEHAKGPLAARTLMHSLALLREMHS